MSIPYIKDAEIFKLADQFIVVIDVDVQFIMQTFENPTLIEVFKHLSRKFKTTEEALKRFKKPIQLKTMPLGKHKGRSFHDIPIEYLRWAAHQNFDQDLLFSLRSELKKRKSGNLFSQATNPFSEL